MYQALYRKWRPRTFDDVLGQRHITETLKRQVETNRLSHAYLFVGTRGTGKTTCAKILSRAVNCEHPVNGNPCNECRSCTGIEDGSILDVVELDAASNNGVDNVRALRDEAIFSPASVKKRVYIIDEVHMLSTSAFNALLKILEEPPAHLMFILATTELHKVPATILSRCQRFSFKRILPDDIAARLKFVAGQESISLTDDGAELLARLSDGAMRDALSLLDQCIYDGPVNSDRVLSAIGLAGTRDTLELFSAVKSGDTVGALEIIDWLYKNGKDMSAVIDELTSLTRDILIYMLSPEKCGGLISGLFDQASISSAASELSPAQIMAWLDILKSAAGDGAAAASGRLDAELCILRLCSSELFPDTAALAVRLDKLEARIASGSVPTPVQEAPLARPRAQSPAPKQDDLPPWDIDTVQPSPDPARPAPAPTPDKPDKAEISTTAEPPAAAPCGSWESILAKAESSIDPPLFFMLSDKSDVYGEISEGALTVRCKNPFTQSIANSPDIIETLKKSAAAVLGRSIKVVVAADSGKAEVSEDKLDSLAKFDIINFE